MKLAAQRQASSKLQGLKDEDEPQQLYREEEEHKDNNLLTARSNEDDQKLEGSQLINDDQTHQ